TAVPPDFYLICKHRDMVTAEGK
ncbi:unnamed protein product, partial [Caenorhabditis auriculariae]